MLLHLTANPLNLDVVAERLAKSRPILEQIKARLDSDILTLDHQSKSYKAVQYTLNNWSNLCRYLYYSDATIDNNAAERAVRPTKLGMKNWLFVGHQKAGQRSAIIYTIIQNCKNHGVDPQAYLQDVLERLTDRKAMIQKLDAFSLSSGNKIKANSEGDKLPFTKQGFKCVSPANSSSKKLLSN